MSALAMAVASAFSGSSQSGKLYVDDVFSTYTYTGNGSSQTINNGIDLAGKGGLVWIKGRTSVLNNELYDTSRGATKVLSTNKTNGQYDQLSGLTSFGTSGFSVGSAPTVNTSGDAFSSWTFRKAPKFSDVITYVGDGVAGRQIPHNLGIAPGMVIVKRTDIDGYGWVVWHRGNGSNKFCASLNRTDAGYSIDLPSWVTSANQSTFTVQNSNNQWGSELYSTNEAGASYIAYVLAHDDSADGIIKCGSFTTDSSGNATVNLGWEPQFGIWKGNYSGENWEMVDVMRGWPVGANNDASLRANSTDAEAAGSNRGEPTSTGFSISGYPASRTYYYLFIRRPNKPPVTGMSVFKPSIRQGNGISTNISGAGFPVDVLITMNRTGDTTSPGAIFSRITGADRFLAPSKIDSENTSYTISSFNQDGFKTNGGYWNSSSYNYSDLMIKRAPGFMDEVCDSGTGVAHTINHGLTVVPELIIRKNRTSADNWAVYHKDIGVSSILKLNTTDTQANGAGYWNNTAPTSSVFSVGAAAVTNASGSNFVTYLFATLPGVSKVGIYTGNGSTQNIDCGFSSGARFLLVKRIDAAGDWIYWDVARGIVAANDPHLSLNSTAAEVTTDDSVDPYAAGFSVNQNTATNINVSGGTYIYLSVA